MLRACFKHRKRVWDEGIPTEKKNKKKNQVTVIIIYYINMFKIVEKKPCNDTNVHVFPLPGRNFR